MKYIINKDPRGPLYITEEEMKLNYNCPADQKNGEGKGSCGGATGGAGNEKSEEDIKVEVKTIGETKDKGGESRKAMSAKEFIPQIRDLPDDQKLSEILGTKFEEPGPHADYLNASKDLTAAKGKPDYQEKVDAFMKAEERLYRTPQVSPTTATKIIQGIAKLDKELNIRIVNRDGNIQIKSPNWQPGSNKRERAEKLVSKLQEISTSLGIKNTGRFEGKYKR